MKTLLGTVFASALFVLGAAADGWDGDSWVYDQSARVEVQPSSESGSLATLDSVFQSFWASSGGDVDSCFMSFGVAEPTSVSMLPAGLFIIVH